MRRALTCFCGQYLEGDNDQELYNWAHAHAERQHPDMQLTDDQVRQMVKEGAHDTRGKAFEK